MRLLSYALVVFVAFTAKAENSKNETRCGWIDNPSPANWSLTDRDGEWIIGVQGGYQAKGDLPDFGKHWVETNVHYGYGCACLKVTTNKHEKKILTIANTQVLPIKQCKSDKALDQKFR